MCKLCKEIDRKVAKGEGFTPEEFNKSLLVHLKPLGITKIKQVEVPEETTFDVKFVSRPKPSFKERTKGWEVEFDYSQKSKKWIAFRYYEGEKIDELSTLNSIESLLGAILSLYKY